MCKGVQVYNIGFPVQAQPITAIWQDARHNLVTCTSDNIKYYFIHLYI